MPFTKGRQVDSLDSSVPVKSDPLINSSDVDDFKLFDGTATVPEHYFVPERGYPTLFLPISIDQAVYDASSVHLSIDPGVMILAFEFS